MGPFVKHDTPVLSPTPDSICECSIEKGSLHWQQRNVYFGRKIRVGTGEQTVAMGKTTWLSFDYFEEGT